MQAQFSSLIQQFIHNTADTAAQGRVQANLSPVSNCNDTNSAPAYMLPLSFPAAVATITQPRNSPPRL